MPRLAEQALERQLARHLALDRAHEQPSVRVWRAGLELPGTRGRHTWNGRPPATRGALRAVIASELVKILEQSQAVLGGDRLGMKLHAPHRPAAVLDPHHDALVGPRGHAALGAEVAGDRERVVAHNREALRDAREQALAVVLDGAQSPVHDDRRAAYRAVEQVTESLVAEAHAEHRDLAEAQDVRADAEVVPALGPPGAR